MFIMGVLNIMWCRQPVLCAVVNSYHVSRLRVDLCVCVVAMYQ